MQACRSLSYCRIWLDWDWGEPSSVSSRGGGSRQPRGHYTNLLEASVGKDTMTGHWEMMGLHMTEPFKTFTENGFPEALIDAAGKGRTGHKVIGNRAASGTEILDVLGKNRISAQGL